jgi:predicted DNA-binding transcriptional regulator AlpA
VVSVLSVPRIKFPSSIANTTPFLGLHRSNLQATNTSLTTNLLALKAGVVDRTIDRWVGAGVLPQPMRINKIRYWDEAEIEQLERERIASQTASREMTAAQERRARQLNVPSL